MGGVYLSEGKNGGSILRCRKKWGEETLAAEGRVYLHTPPLGVILAASLSRIVVKIGLYLNIFKFQDIYCTYMYLIARTLKNDPLIGVNRQHFNWYITIRVYIKLAGLLVVIQ